MNNYTLHVEYDKSIRSLDLENILAGFRLLQEEELERKTGKAKRNFADSIIIDKVDKGSIIIELSVNIDIHINIINILMGTVFCANVEKFPPIINAAGSALAKIISAIKHGVILTITDKNNNDVIEISESKYKNVYIKNKKDGTVSEIIFGEQENKRNKNNKK